MVGPQKLLMWRRLPNQTPKGAVVVSIHNLHNHDRDQPVMTGFCSSVTPEENKTGQHNKTRPFIKRPMCSAWSASHPQAHKKRCWLLRRESASTELVLVDGGQLVQLWRRHSICASSSINIPRWSTRLTGRSHVS